VSSNGVAVDVVVEGPDVGGLADVDLRRMFPERQLSGGRLNRLRNWPRVIVRIGDALAGVATCTQTPFETQIPDFAINVPLGVRSDQPELAQIVLEALLDAIELTALRNGCSRVVLAPSGPAAALEQRGYVSMGEGTWMEKSFC
jgi:hypothetical protein